MRKEKKPVTAEKKKKRVKILAVVLAVVLTVAIGLGIWAIPVKGEANSETWSADDSFRMEDTVQLQKEPGKDFVILNLTDIQYSDTLDFAQRGYTKETIRTLIEETKPDLVTMTGDQVWTPFQKQSQGELIAFIDSFKIPWAPVFGNHDGEGNADKQWLADRYLESEYCLFKKGPNNIGGVGNYVINVMEGNKIVQSLIMMDSGAGYNYKDTPESEFMMSDAIDSKTQEYILNADGSRKQDYFGTNYMFIEKTQIAWYKWVIAGLTAQNGGVTPESTAMFHIALPEFHLAYLQWKDSGYDPAMGFGEKREQVCCPKINTGFFEVMKELGSTKNVVVGHDHVNCYSVLYDGIRLSYGLKTGDRCYADNDLNGGTVLTVSDGGVTVEHKYVEVK